MEADGGDPTQPTQNVLDPRRIGQQNSGFSDEDISDILCLLYPYSPFARQEVHRIAQDDKSHIVGTDEAAAIEPNYEEEDQADRFRVAPANTGEYAVILRLSADVKDPLLGFQFGRNHGRCDFCFRNDPMKRLSNVHFRIYVNEYGVVMLEDQSTNGTIVDSHLLRGKNPNDKADVRRTLTHGSRIKILMHAEARDLEFLVRIPKREGSYDRAYIHNLEDYFDRLKELREERANRTLVPGTGGHPDLFAAPKTRAPARPRIPLPSGTTHENVDRFPKEWRGSDRYNRVGQIGKGAFAVVHKVTSKFDGNPYAAKELEKRRFMKDGVLDQKVENEMKIMQRVNHPNVVRYIEHFDWENRLLIIIMEYVPGGDLGKLVVDRGPLPEPLVQQMTSQLLSAIGYLHENNITHRDVKPDNILIQSVNPFEVKLTDFGLSKIVDNESTFLQTFCGTLLYCAPEVYSEYTEYDDHGFRQPRNRQRRPPQGQRYDHAVDIWSLGGVLFYSLTTRPPYPVKNGISYSELLHQIMTTQLNTVPLIQKNVSHEAVHFLCSMLQRRPEERATISDLQHHPWQGGGPRPDDERSLDEVTDDELEVGASQLSLQEGQGRHFVDPSPAREVLDEVLDDLLEEFSDKENSGQHDTFGRPGKGPRLFGELNVSAMGSSGVIPADRLNLPLSGPRRRAEDSMETEIQDSVGSGDSSARGNGSAGGVQLSMSAAHGQSMDQLQSLVENVRSQSLGAAESAVQDDLRVKSPTASQSVLNGSYYTASKRKPGYDTSDEFEERRQKEKPVFKRLRSEGNMETLADQALEECILLASMPLVKRLESGRLIDGPQDKTFFWVGRELATWHLEYPEMTELQRQVFEQAAEARKESFTPGKSPLWDLAMKYFPPTPLSQQMEDTEPPSGPATAGVMPRAALHRETRNLADLVDSSMVLPPTAPVPQAEEEEDSLPDTLPPTQRIVPILAEEGAHRALAVLESAPDSVIPGIAVPITDALMSWGRSPENTAIYTPRSETKVPKFAIKVLLWKDGYDPSRRSSSKTVQPWEQEGDSTGYSFYVSTKATMGIHVNGFHLRSSKPPTSSPEWVQLHNGDEIVVWGGMGDPQKTKLIFRCFWGGSAQARPACRASPPRPVSSSVARRIEEAFVKTEKRMRAEAERNRKMEEAQRDLIRRQARVHYERERTRVFEERILDAREHLAAVKATMTATTTMTAASRRGSPASAPPTGTTTTTRLNLGT
ncbi:hypothetical protein SODALDRAFT_139146 [Sodiomyces alkalinus F11]|uniref:Autophagy-related protein 1 n=1 Tax=Sodiomyces alkalinus (strain CBS 110278 / VKM F-3762 / F11) TaxID=1314773 RepID=A0A3N2PZ85_SODAK|nr:hypothetical protein SODALDRAFT_139146 [Sodiomyces alkalinus F11]ROT39843.1 hypothetical protein SODALDRAFT_139146 [Sodiomyces alkalinus F11]